MTALTRRYHFSASHRLHAPSLSEAENTRIFGKCSNPYGHGHDYVLSVTVSGDVDGSTGLIVRVDDLDQLVEDEILQRFAHRNMNADVPQFKDVVPTTENVALVMAHLLDERWASYFADQPRLSLLKIHLQETDRNGFEVHPKDFRPRIVLISKQESVVVHV